MSGDRRIPATLIRGDGIGPEITAAPLAILDALDAPFDWDEQQGGMTAFAALGTPLPEQTLDSIRNTRLALKGPLTTPVGDGFRSANVELRKIFGLYANVRPARSYVSNGRFEDVDIVLVRENTEGLYVGVEHFIPIEDDPHAVAEASGIITRSGSRRIAEYAFEYAVTHGHKKITIVHKANILKCLSGLFLETANRVGEEFKGKVEIETRIVDACAMQLVQDPSQFDMILTTNMFGDILSDLMAGLVGGLGLTPGANIGKDAAIFEAVHGSAPDIAGQGIANPTALLLASAMMLDHVDEYKKATRLREAIQATISEGTSLTGDLGGKAGTDQYAKAVIAKL